jgi:hypothetical protein
MGWFFAIEEEGANWTLDLKTEIEVSWKGTVKRRGIVGTRPQGINGVATVWSQAPRPGLGDSSPRPDHFIFFRRGFYRLLDRCAKQTRVFHFRMLKIASMNRRTLLAQRSGLWDLRVIDRKSFKRCDGQKYVIRRNQFGGHAFSRQFQGNRKLK